MPSIETLAVAFKKCDVNNNGFIEREELGEVLKVAGVTQTRGEFLETLEALLQDDRKRIGFKQFVGFFKNKVSTGTNSKYNRLMMKSIIGRPKHSSYDLPGEYHTYGAKVPRDKEGSKEVILTWIPFKAQSTEEKKLNIVKMNKRAVQQRHLTAKDMTSFNKDHPIYDKKVYKSRTNTVSTQVKFGNSQSLPDGRAFGITKRASTPIRDLVCGKYNDNYDDSRGEPFYPQNNASVNRIKQKNNKKTFDGTRPTKASVGHGRAARQRLESLQKPSEPFKMKRFKCVEHRVQTKFTAAGNAVVGRSPKQQDTSLDTGGEEVFGMEEAATGDKGAFRGLHLGNLFG